MSQDTETLRIAPRTRAEDAGFRLLILRDDTWENRQLPGHGEVVVGRGEDATVRIDDRSISRRHARISFGAVLEVEDLGSANGTRVGATVLSANQKASFALGETLEVGSVVLVLQREPGHGPVVAPPPSAPSDSDPMQRIWRLVDRIAPSQINVLLTGESGVGKEVISTELHRRSKRSAGPFLRLNCASLSETLLESELFGHEKGAFTGAVKTKPGLFETAAGGTVLLDEVGELPASIQAKLLRVLEERQVLRVGGLKPEPIDVRFIFATNRDLEAEVARGTFRADLYYRLNGITLTLPPLRERRGEIPTLAASFIQGAAEREGLNPAPALTPEALRVLEQHAWPGNIRELRNVVERAVILCGGDPIRPEHLVLQQPRAQGAPAASPAAPPAPAAAPSPAAPASSDPAERLKQERFEAEKRVILDALEQSGGNQTRAAEVLGISRRTLVSRLQAYGLTSKRRT